MAKSKGSKGGLAKAASKKRSKKKKELTWKDIARGISTANDLATLVGAAVASYPYIHDLVQGVISGVFAQLSTDLRSLKNDRGMAVGRKRERGKKLLLEAAYVVSQITPLVELLSKEKVHEVLGEAGSKELAADLAVQIRHDSAAHLAIVVLAHFRKAVLEGLPAAEGPLRRRPRV